jgi:hypothetical protein
MARVGAQGRTRYLNDNVVPDAIFSRGAFQMPLAQKKN